VYETPAGMLNAIGLQNPGVDHVVRVILPQLDFSETRFIANACGSTIEEYFQNIVDNGGTVPEDLRRLLRVPDGLTYAVAERLQATWDRRDNGRHS